MPNPKRKHTRMRRDMRRANWKLTSQNVGACPRCGAAKMSHMVCPECGFYKDELVITKKEKSKE
jgi:large subunit ribosomal protein L32